MISICMPYYARQEELDRSLLALRTFYPSAEIVICDDGSPDPVRAPGCVVVTLPRKEYSLNPCVPINRAVARATGEVIVLTGPEIEHRSPVLDEMARDLGPDDYVIAACRDTTGAWLCRTDIRGGVDGRGPMPPGSGFHFCAMLHRTLFERAGGFDEEYRVGQAFEDNDWLFRLDRAGARFRLRDDLVVWHHRTPRRWPADGHRRNRALFAAKWGTVCQTA